MRRPLPTRCHGLTLRRIQDTTRRRGSDMDHVRITLRTRVTTGAGIITAVETRTRIGKKAAVRRVKSVKRGGRPSRADALLLRERILKTATALFLAEGYGSTSIESVAARAGISKRTFYDRFEDKAALFAAVVHRIIGAIRPPENVPLLAGESLPKILRRLAGFFLTAAVSPQAIALHRLVTGESSRFPELARAVQNDGGQAEATGLITGLLSRELPKIKMDAQIQVFAAEQFIYMLVTVPQRRAIGYGTPMTAGELDAWADHVVTLFLEGYEGLGT
jgi:TetR/AcrR family transcriptional regulator, mexJK operon transcriptional repressor